jgi:hypothetical protein
VTNLPHIDVRLPQHLHTIPAEIATIQDVGGVGDSQIGQVLRGKSCGKLEPWGAGGVLILAAQGK